MKGLIFNVQRWSLHDGPGVRTLVFMKGCPLRCKWCDNPEGQANYPELGFLFRKCADIEKCTARCLDSCPVRAIALSEEGKPIIDRETCTKLWRVYQSVLLWSFRVSWEVCNGRGIAGGG